MLFKITFECLSPFLLKRSPIKVRTWRNEDEIIFPLSPSTAKGHPLLKGSSGDLGFTYLDVRHKLAGQFLVEIALWKGLN